MRRRADRVREVLLEAVSRLKLRRCASVGRAPRVLGRVWIHGAGRVRIGDRVRLDGRTTPIELCALDGAELVIGDDVIIEGGTSLEAQGSITVGRGCRLGAFVKVLDNHFHSLKGDRARRPPSMPVWIEEGVELGSRVILLPGAAIGRGARVLPGAILGRRVAPGATVPGVSGAAAPGGGGDGDARRVG